MYFAGHKSDFGMYRRRKTEKVPIFYRKFLLLSKPPHADLALTGNRCYNTQKPFFIKDNAMKEILNTMLSALTRGEGVMLCSILKADGSSPRGAGAHMAVFADGTALGTVGGGAHKRILLDDPASNVYKALYFDGDKLCGAVFLTDVSGAAAAMDAIEKAMARDMAMLLLL